MRAKLTVPAIAAVIVAIAIYRSCDDTEETSPFRKQHLNGQETWYLQPENSFSSANSALPPSALPQSAQAADASTAPKIDWKNFDILQFSDEDLWKILQEEDPQLKKIRILDAGNNELEMTVFEHAIRKARIDATSNGDLCKSIDFQWDGTEIVTEACPSLIDEEQSKIVSCTDGESIRIEPLDPVSIGRSPSRALINNEIYFHYLRTGLDQDASPPSLFCKRSASPKQFKNSTVAIIELEMMKVDILIGINDYLYQRCQEGTFATREECRTLNSYLERLNTYRTELQGKLANVCKDIADALVLAQGAGFPGEDPLCVRMSYDKACPSGPPMSPSFFLSDENRQRWLNPASRPVTPCP